MINKIYFFFFKKPHYRIIRKTVVEDFKNGPYAYKVINKVKVVRASTI